MTARATISQAVMQRAIRAAEACGKVAVLTKDGILFADPERVALQKEPTNDFEDYLARRSERRQQGQDAPARGRR